jgi:hypothetical protein
VKIVDERILERFRLKWKCEWCGKRGPVDPHHLFGKNMGGGTRLDVPINLISLCRTCHQDFHDGRIMRCDLLAVIAARERTLQHVIERVIYTMRRL